MRSLALVLLLTTAALAAPTAEDGVRSIDLERIRELYRLTDRFGERLWPGFDARTVPSGLNHENRLEFLIAHPQPPDVFRVLDGQDLAGVPILIRDGCDRPGPGSGGVAADLYGLYAVYMNTLQAGNTTQNYLSVFLHECFHVYQRTFREYPDGRKTTTPKYDAPYSALLGLESRILHAAVREEDDDAARALTRMFLAVRRERRAKLEESVVRSEGDREYNEGTATYVQVRLFELLLEADDFERVLEDPLYDGFESAAASREKHLDGILPHAKSPISFRHASYHVGMAQCLLLDRIHPAWKEALRAKGSTLTGVLERRLPVLAEDAGALSEAAKTRFNYAELLAEQTRLVEHRLAKIRQHVAGPGRRYRIHTAGLGGIPRSRSRGPAWPVPRELLPGRGPITIYARGVSYRRGGLTLETERVPVLMNPGYVEWIDREPAPDGSDLVIEYDRKSGTLYEGLRMKTDGFVLTADRARVRLTKDEVTIRAVRPGSR